ncbi:MAG TPA: amino acid ABC transporter permease [Actinomycetota bacterium]|nr:amino acid ABC transporter permease [Actinomycetota bacterium]
MSELWDVLVRHFPQFRSGFLVTLRLVAISFVVAMVAGTLVGALRAASSRWLRWIGAVYVEFFRNIPLLVLIFIAFLGLRGAGIRVGPWAAGTASLGLYTGAYVAEAIRSGVFSVGSGQVEAGLSLGLTYRGVLRRIVLPQAVRTVIPPLGNLTIAMIKNSAIVGASLLAIPDLLKEARVINNDTFQTTETFFWAAVGYLILTVSATVAVRFLERRLAVRR